MRVHLITYATRRFRHRQILLGWSAMANRVVDTVTHWNPERLGAAGFQQLAPEIRLSERGSGFWAWKPFIISKTLEAIPEGEMVFYCDVGRGYPYKLLEHSMEPYYQWMAVHNQDVMPGVHIPWKGPMSMWTKRDAWQAVGVDHPKNHGCSPIQASFSFWKNSGSSRKLASEWLNYAIRRPLISDDPSVCGLPEYPDFHEHRHDQSLLSLCCIKSGISGLPAGCTPPEIDTQHPTAIWQYCQGPLPPCRLFSGRCVAAVASVAAFIEAFLRRGIRFGSPRIEQPNSTGTNHPSTQP